ncbi:ABC transporter ATP-binding protein [Halorarum halophilum]|uniref:ABC transporter ATP-binding protein n=1 Tax=Halorarum halophilum TaxID=2743090 RepID=A0A7D5K2A4_9EURY|nr:ABC transporter ATP-binding protein [Halobaculum halophilum]QLG28661.1 ABC transporter ATP-binding protein [Halobaculum halophilum]
MSLIELHEVDTGYEENQVLYDLSMRIEPDRVNCIIGPNGSGKSTTLKAIYGLIDVWDGTISIRDEDVTNCHPRDVLERGVVMLPQDGNVFPEMTVKENLRIGGYLIDDDEVLERRYEQVYDMFPVLEEKRGQRADQLSGGQQMMVAFGRAMMPDPDILLLDEPSAGLAPDLVADVFEQVELLKDQGEDMIIVEQNVRAMLEIADYVYVLDQGRLEFEGETEQLRDESDIMEMYIGERHG